MRLQDIVEELRQIESHVQSPYSLVDIIHRLNYYINTEQKRVYEDVTKSTLKQTIRPQRRCGNTTRLVDYYIQKFFEEGIILVDDVQSNSQIFTSNSERQRLFGIIQQRLYHEHRNVVDNVEFNSNRYMIRFKEIVNGVLCTDPRLRGYVMFNPNGKSRIEEQFDFKDEDITNIKDSTLNDAMVKYLKERPFIATDVPIEHDLPLANKSKSKNNYQ